MPSLRRMRIGIVVLSIVSMPALSAKQMPEIRGHGHLEIPA